MDERQRLHRGEIDGDVVRLQVEAHHQHVRVGEQEEEALDQEDRQRDHEPLPEMDGHRSAGQFQLDASGDAGELDHAGRVGGGDGGQDAGSGIGREAGPHGKRHEGQDQQRTHDVGRRQGEQRPGMGAGDALQQVRQRDHRQAQRAEQERNDIVALHPVGQEPDAERAERGDQSGYAEHEKPAGEQDAAQFRKQAAFAIFGNEADDGCVEAEAGEAADDDRRGPDQDEDAVFEGPHPARHQDLAGKGDDGADDADDEGDQRYAAGFAAFVGREQQAVDTVEQRLGTQRHALRQQPLGCDGRGKAHAILRLPPDGSGPSTKRVKKPWAGCCGRTAGSRRRDWLPSFASFRGRAAEPGNQLSSLAD